VRESAVDRRQLVGLALQLLGAVIQSQVGQQQLCVPLRQLFPLAAERVSGLAQRRRLALHVMRAA
jgi:hypothetical protein